MTASVCFNAHLLGRVAQITLHVHTYKIQQTSTKLKLRQLPLRQAHYIYKLL